MGANYPELVAKAIKAQQFNAALDIYASWFDAEPAFFLSSKALGQTQQTHIKNAANLARKALYDKVQVITNVSSRINKAIRFYFGLEAKQFEQPLQQPSFFYIPGLPAKPFYTVEEIPGLADILVQLNGFKPDLLALGQNSYQQYVETSGPVPNTTDWQNVKQKWLSTHLLRGDKKTPFADSKLTECQKVLEHPTIAHCPPHAAEAFVSSLLCGAKIPAHYGISNVKLTVHMPLQVNAAAYLRAGDEQRYWSEHDKAIVFDDSFLHSAANQGGARRDVFIFDVWHPSLTVEEQNAIKHFMAEHQLWSEKYAKLAALDARL
ncbi:aspartyl/asparaginyl beta-hydroxylase domain-containing protein [Rheinheimera baltica]|uniref:aspartyl/asparaginyl beta-hydroxylase domain-containing protein n=1 Tax=Rheinheimera baltica TaxID=67576 RepID=UPI002740071C|nr:aspartyl/asparaginyl beta-hydroxylase domain-containing protein [Rheinheimera baltica]MDP5141729.1 aspartyl/asparaginyl beta-hydroxylase domain-containing protein [Rheinheimera baltica]